MAVAGKTTRFNPAAPRRKASKRGASTMSRGRTQSAQPKTNEARTSLPERSEPRKANSSDGRSAEPGAHAHGAVGEVVMWGIGGSDPAVTSSIRRTIWRGGAAS